MGTWGVSKEMSGPRKKSPFPFRRLRKKRTRLKKEEKRRCQEIRDKRPKLLQRSLISFESREDVPRREKGGRDRTQPGNPKKLPREGQEKS